VQSTELLGYTCGKEGEKKNFLFQGKFWKNASGVIEKVEEKVGGVAELYAMAGQSLNQSQQKENKESRALRRIEKTICKIQRN